MVFTVVRGKGIPLVMVTSGGYQRRTADVIARSILNLRDKRLVENAPSAQQGTLTVQGETKTTAHATCFVPFQLPLPM